MLKLNLLPREYMLKRKYRRAATLIAGLFAAVLVALGCAAVLCQRQGRQVAEVKTRLAESSLEAAELVGRIERADEQVTEALRNANQHASLLDRVPASCVLAMVANALPERAALTAFDLEVGPASKAKTPSRRPRGADAEAPAPQALDRSELRQKVGLGGTAVSDVDVANFMASLSRSPLVERVELVQSREKLIDSRAFREFLVEIDLKPNADAMDLQATSKAKATPGGDPAVAAGRSEGI